MAGKSWQPSHEPPRGRETEQAPVTLVKQWKRGREGGGVGQPMIGAPTAQRNANAYKRAKRCNATTPSGEEHMESWCMRILRCRWPQRGWLVLLVVNSIKLHLIALNGWALVGTKKVAIIMRGSTVVEWGELEHMSPATCMWISASPARLVSTWQVAFVHSYQSRVFLT